jgi:hypothetical protein
VRNYRTSSEPSQITILFGVVRAAISLIQIASSFLFGDSARLIDRLEECAPNWY